MMTKEEAAAKLDGCEYGAEGSKDLWAQFKESGLVAIFGASDDLIEMRGAIDDEFGVYGDGYIRVNRSGPISECEDQCAHYRRAKESASLIVAKWDDGSGYSWTYKTAIPHATFDVVETDGDERALYCRGIVFALADLPA